MGRSLTMQLLACGLTFAALVGSVQGCTFLISFDPVDGGKDSGFFEEEDEDSGPIDPPIRRDASPVEPDVFVPPANGCEPSVDLNQITCTGITRAKCGNGGKFPGYAGDDRDLIVCDGNLRPTCVKRCRNGCISIHENYPDECDECDGKANGHHCGSEMTGWDTRNANWALACQNNKYNPAPSFCGNPPNGSCAVTCPVNDRVKPACCVNANGN